MTDTPDMPDERFGPVAMAVQSICEGTPADPEHPDTVSKNVYELLRTLHDHFDSAQSHPVSRSK